MLLFAHAHVGMAAPSVRLGMGSLILWNVLAKARICPGDTPCACVLLKDQHPHLKIYGQPLVLCTRLQWGTPLAPEEPNVPGVK